jgi:hypothetical protein
MMENDELKKYLDGLLRFGELMLAGDINDQANFNLICINVDGFGSAPLDRAHLCYALVYLKKIFKNKKKDVSRAKFYSWYDAQSGQLRVSAIADDLCRLPFKCRYSITSDHLDVVEDVFSEISSLYKTGLLLVYVEVI